MIAASECMVLSDYSRWIPAFRWAALASRVWVHIESCSHYRPLINLYILQTPPVSLSLYKRIYHSIQDTPLQETREHTLTCLTLHHEHKKKSIWN